MTLENYPGSVERWATLVPRDLLEIQNINLRFYSLCP